MVDPLLRVGAFFVLKEFSAHDGVLPPPSTHQALRDLCRLTLDPMRRIHGPCTVLSGYRGEARNRAVGGAKSSHHLYRRHPGSPAADVRFTQGTPDEWAATAVLLGTPGVGTYPTHVHVDRRATVARW